MLYGKTFTPFRYIVPNVFANANVFEKIINIPCSHIAVKPLSLAYSSAKTMSHPHSIYNPVLNNRTNSDYLDFGFFFPKFDLLTGFKNPKILTHPRKTFAKYNEVMISNQKFPHNGATYHHLMGDHAVDSALPTSYLTKKTKLSPLTPLSKESFLKQPQTRTDDIGFWVNLVRLKPGLKTLWSELRVQFARLSLFRPTRQVRITKFAMLSRSTSGFAFIKNTALSASFIIKQSGLLGMQVEDLNLRRISSVFPGWTLNGYKLTNPLIQLYFGDVLMLHASLGSSWVTQPQRLKSMYPTKNKPLWLEGAALYPAPWYLEVDELTQTISVIGSPKFMSEFRPDLFMAKPFLTHRMLNWKYLT